MEQPAADLLAIEVCYALPERQDVAHLRLPPGATLGEALTASGLLVKYPEISRDKNKFGIYGKLVKTDAVLRDRDRVEIYRPLTADPKELRRLRAAAGKALKRGAGKG
ncbi:MAG: RnfH family protein [Azonexus sp.]|jgi:putative ubiquitin-RnfH superfamily antitoxin RatB of RatAB toxin-antitoxin module|nr:RnfH family protein [Azonexus sp.]